MAISEPARSTAPRLRVNAIWMIVGQGVLAFSQWATLVVLARLGGPEEVGQFALALAIVTPIILFSRLQLRQMYVSDPRAEQRSHDYTMLRVGTTLLAGAVVLGIGALGLYPSASNGVLLAVLLLKASESQSEVLYGVVQRHERLDLIARSLMLRGIFGVVALGLAMALTQDVTVAVLAMAAAWGAVWWLFDRRVSRPWWGQRLRASEILGRWRAWGELAWLGVPLGFVSLLTSLNSNVPRYFIEADLGHGAVGVFAAMAYFAVAGNMVINAVSQATSPRLVKSHLAGAPARFRSLLLKALAVAAALGLAGIAVALLAGRELLRLVYGPSFAEQPEIFVLVMVAAMVGYLAAPFGYGMTAMRMFHVQLLVFLIVVAVNALLCLLLIPTLGLSGAVLGWLGGLACQLLLGAWLNWRGLRAQRAPAGARADG